MSEQPPYRFAAVAPVFGVRELRHSLAFYTEQLRFTSGFQWRDADAEPIRYAIVQQGETELHLSQTAEVRPALAYFFVHHIQAYHAAVRAAFETDVAPFASALADQPWEMREFEVLDPDGNRLIFGEHLSRIDATSP